MKYQNIDFSVNNGIAWVFLNRPERRNALNVPTLAELIHAFNFVDESEDIKVAVLSGRGNVFAAGADLKEMKEMNHMGYLELGGHLNTVGRTIRENSKPVVGMINGHALGGGCILGMAPDLIIAAEEATFGLPEIKRGVFGGAAIMPRLVGRYRAAEIVLLGEAYTAREALEMGLVNRVAPREELPAAVEAMTTKLCSYSPLALKMAKKSLVFGNRYDLDTANEMQLPLMSMLFGGHDQQEGMRSFFEKRDPVYTGKW